MTTYNYTNEQYNIEKLTGVRGDNGARCLDKLSPKHYQIVHLHMQGMKGSDIAVTAGVTQSTVSIVLNDPLVKKLKDQFFKQFEDEFNALYQKTVDVIRDSLQEDKPDNVRLKAAKMFLDDAPVRQELEQKRDTAEDVVQRLLQVNNAENVNVQINQHIEKKA